jgi:hypothetical protein
VIAVWLSCGFLLLGAIAVWHGIRVQSGNKLPRVPPSFVPRGCCWRGPVKAYRSNSGHYTHRRPSSRHASSRPDEPDPE